MKVKSNILIVFYSFPLQIITQLYIYLSKINVFYLCSVYKHEQVIFFLKGRGERGREWGRGVTSSTFHSQMLKGVVSSPDSIS